MKHTKQKQPQSANALKDVLSKYDELNEKVESARAKLEKHKCKQQALETQIEHLTRQLYEPYTQEIAQTTDGGDVRRARLIFNPAVASKDGGTKQLREMVKCLRQNGILAEVDLQLSDEMLQEMVKEAIENEEDLVIVAGGDEMVEQVAALLVGTQTVLGIMPVGALNHHAEALGIPLDLETACALFGKAITRRIEAGQLIAGAQGSLMIVDGQMGAASNGSV